MRKVRKLDRIKNTLGQGRAMYGCLLLCWLAFLPLQTFAQLDQSQSWRLRALSFEGIMDGYSYAPVAGNKVGEPVAMPQIRTRSISASWTYSGSNELVFYAPGGEAGPGASDPVAHVKLPTDKREILLIFFPVEQEQEKTGMRYVVYPVEDSIRVFPVGSYLFVNITPHPLLAKLGDAYFKLGEGASTVIRLDDREKGSLGIRVYDPEIRERPLLQQVWYHYPNARVVVFLREEKQPQPYLVVQSVAEFARSTDKPGELEIRSVKDK